MKNPYLLPGSALFVGILGNLAGFEGSPIVTLLNAFGVLGLIYVWLKRRKSR